MPFDEDLALRVRHALRERDDMAEIRMFGGLCFMVRGNMCCGIMGDSLMVRVGVEAYEESISRPHVRPMDVTGRPMRGWVIVNRDGLTDEKDLESWVGLGLAFNNTLPEKAGNRRRRR